MKKRVTTLDVEQMIRRRMNLTCCKNRDKGCRFSDVTLRFTGGWSMRRIAEWINKGKP